MRILHVTDRASARGGADWHLLGVLEALAERGHSITLAVGRVDGTASVPCEVVEIEGLDDPGPRPAVRKRLDAAAHSCDVVHVHNAIGPDVLDWAGQRGAVATVQDHRSFCPGRGKVTLAGEVCRSTMSPEVCAGCFEDGGYAARIAAVTEARCEALRRMRAVTVLSRYMSAELAALGIEAAVIPPFVHGLDPSAAPAGPPCVLFAGRLVEAKGARDAAEAWRRADLDLPLVFAGTGRMRRALERAGHEVLGWVPHGSMAGVYRRARAVVVPSRWQEPFGIVGLEALALGVPVAAWRSGGIADWHPGGALLVPWGDLDALAEALSHAVTSNATPPEGFERETLTDRLEAIYGR